jgi:hypothetical protein
VADLGLALGDPGLEQLLDSRQAGGDVQAGDAAGVERPHRQLRARLADRLRGDDADRLADLDHLPVARLRPHIGTRRERTRRRRERTSTSTPIRVDRCAMSRDHLVAGDDERERSPFFTFDAGGDGSAAADRPTTGAGTASSCSPGWPGVVVGRHG